MAVVEAIPAGLRRHWATWLGASSAQVAQLGDAAEAAWPRIDVVPSPLRDTPGWDGEIHPLVGIVDDVGRAIVSVAPTLERVIRDVAAKAHSVDALRVALAQHLRLAPWQVYRATYRWSVSPTPAHLLPDAGQWVPVSDERLPPWLHPFGGDALVAFDAGGDGPFLAGVGCKRHDAYVHELAVGTVDQARGRGLARRLVAQAARELLGNDVVATYLHDPNNIASARVAEAAGFPDRGWTALGLFRPQ